MVTSINRGIQMSKRGLQKIRKSSLRPILRKVFHCSLMLWHQRMICLQVTILKVMQINCTIYYAKNKRYHLYLLFLILGFFSYSSSSFMASGEGLLTMDFAAWNKTI